MKVLFLDIDGVLNHDNWYSWRQYCWKNNMTDKLYDQSLNDERTIYLSQEIDERSIANLNKIVDATGCKVVLSSSWRSSSEQENIYTNYILKLKGFKHKFYSVTPYSVDRIRGIEIDAWLNKAEQTEEIESYVILDDDTDMLPEQMNNFINIDSKYGLSDADVDLAIKILNNER